MSPEVEFMFADYRSPSPEQQSILNDLRKQHRDLASEIDAKLPPCRERSLALTKLEEASIFCAKAVFRLVKPPEDA